MNQASQPYNGGPDSAHPSTVGEGNPAPSGAHEAPVSQPESGDDPGEFGIGIMPNPKARYWQGRAAFWRNQAIARGYKITEEADPPGDAWQRARELLAEEWKRDGHPAMAHALLNADLLSDKNPAIRAIARALSESAVGPLPAVHGEGGPEADFIADGEHLNCPACGGSGHVDDAPPASVPGGDGDITKEQLDWLVANEYDLCTRRELIDEDEYAIWWFVVDSRKSTQKYLHTVSGHPLGSPREAIEAAMNAEAGGEVGRG